MSLGFLSCLFVFLFNYAPQALLSWVEGSLYKLNLNFKYQSFLRGET